MFYLLDEACADFRRLTVSFFRPKLSYAPARNRDLIYVTNKFMAQSEIAQL
jgi:hypothetical protein